MENNSKILKKKGRFIIQEVVPIKRDKTRHHSLGKEFLLINYNNYNNNNNSTNKFYYFNNTFYIFNNEKNKWINFNNYWKKLQKKINYYFTEKELEIFQYYNINKENNNIFSFTSSDDNEEILKKDIITTNNNNNNSNNTNDDVKNNNDSKNNFLVEGRKKTKFLSTKINKNNNDNNNNFYNIIFHDISNNENNYFDSLNNLNLIRNRNRSYSNKTIDKNKIINKIKIKHTKTFKLYDYYNGTYILKVNNKNYNYSIINNNSLNFINNKKKLPYSKLDMEKCFSFNI